MRRNRLATLLLPLALASAGCSVQVPAAAEAAGSEVRKARGMKELQPGLLVAPQITVADVERAAKSGIRTIIMNRPDGEEPGQPTSAELRAAAEARGLTFHHIPVSGGQFPTEAVAAMADAIEGSDGPVLAFCRSGARSATLWALGRAGKDPPETIIAAGRRIGQDFGPLGDRLQTPSVETAR